MIQEESYLKVADNTGAKEIHLHPGRVLVCALSV